MDKNSRSQWLLAFGLLAVVLLGCEKADDFPGSSEEIEESVKITRGIAEEGSIFLDEAIATAYNQDGMVDPVELAEKIISIDGVKSAIPSPSGSGIIIEQVDGTYSNLLVVTADNEKLFKNDNPKSFSESKNSFNGINDDDIIPFGKAKALILAPFQSSFQTDLIFISQQLKCIGYRPDIFIDEAANLDKFRAGFLAGYDIVLIVTHGGSDLKTNSGTTSTLVSTGEEYSSAKLLSIPEPERKAIGKVILNGRTYFTLSVPWLGLSHPGSFKSSWIFVAACESSIDKESSASLSGTFINMGIGGFNGFKGSINVTLLNTIATLMVSEFASGLTFIKASDNVRNNPGFYGISSLLRIKDSNGSSSFTTVTVNLLENIQQNNSKPYYLITPLKYDHDGNSYKTIRIGSQTWLAENLRARHFNNGDPINGCISIADQIRQLRNSLSIVINAGYGGFTCSQLVDTGLIAQSHRSAIENFSYIVGISDPSLKTIQNLFDELSIPLSKLPESYGLLYDWYSVSDPRKICPAGFHVPSKSDWDTLITYLGGSEQAGGKLKETGNAHWLSPNTGATNDAQFYGLPAGFFSSTYENLGKATYWWTTAEQGTDLGLFAGVMYSSPGILGGFIPKRTGASVRCVADQRPGQ